MLLKIEYDESQVIKKTDKSIILNVQYYSEFANGPWICTVKGTTVEDFEANDLLTGKTIFIGQRGGLSLE